MHFPTGQVIAEEQRDLGTAKSLKAAKAIAASDWAQRSAISTDPLPATKPTALEWKSVTPYLEPSFPFRPLTLQSSSPRCQPARASRLGSSTAAAAAAGADVGAGWSVRVSVRRKAALVVMCVPAASVILASVLGRSRETCKLSEGH